MALVGKLEDLQLAELFHLLSLFRKTGKLTLTSGGATGTFYFRNGKICHASSGCPGPALGELLVRRSLISPGQLESALRRQVERSEWRRLGTVPVELARRLGGPRPREAVAIPIVVDGMMAAVFYGDNVPKQDAIGSVKGIELLMIEAGLAMERRLLQAKLRRVEEQLQTLERGSTREVGA